LPAAVNDNHAGEARRPYIGSIRDLRQIGDRDRALGEQGFDLAIAEAVLGRASRVCWP
jgi:hypothetical protein